jgi:hypothetical protein
MDRRKSWREKLEKPSQAKVVEIPPKMRKRFGTGSMLIPVPTEVDGLVRTVGEGQLTTPGRIREVLAAKYGADVTCPLVTGIFLWIAANTAEEDAGAGKRRITPYWRVVKDDGALNPRFPGGVEAQARKLRAEGHVIEKRGKTWRVADFEGALVMPGASSAANR